MKTHRALVPRRPNLLIVNRGPDTRVETAALEPSDKRNWDLVEIWWHPRQIEQIEKEVIFPGADGVYLQPDRTRFKFASVKDLASVFGQHNGTLAASYSNVAIIDDDIKPAPGITWSAIFDLFDESGARVGQPALTRRSFFAHEITRQEPVSRWRAVTFVEVMCPIFDSAALANLLPYFDKDPAQNGLEALWSGRELVEGNWLTILDATPVEHLREVTGGGGAGEDLADLTDSYERFLNRWHLLKPDHRVVHREANKVDVCFYDTIGSPFNAVGDRAGGSEWATIKVARELAGRGLEVLVLTNGGPFEQPQKFGSGIIHFAPYESCPEIHASALVIQRFSQMPPRWNRDSARLFFALHDLYTDENAAAGYLAHSRSWLDERKATAICVSEWQSSQYPSGWLKAVASRPIGTGGRLSPEKIPGRYVYCAAGMKGLRETLAYWRKLARPGMELRLVLPDYGHVKFVRASNVTLVDTIGGIKPGQLETELAQAEGVFYVNTYPECLPASLAMAEQLGCRIHVLGLCPEGLAGIEEAVNSRYITRSATEFEDVFSRNAQRSRDGVRPAVDPPKDFSAKRAGDTWMKLLGFEE